MKYIFIGVFLFIFFEVPIQIKGYDYVDDNVISFDYASNEIITYVSHKNDEYSLKYKNGIEDIEIIKTKSKISFPSISNDGNFIVFNSTSLLNENRICTSILDGEIKICNDIYLYTKSDNTLINITSTFNGDSYIPSISGNGRYIAFSSSSSNITNDHIFTCKTYKNDINRYCSNIYVYDIINKNYKLISKNILSGSNDSMEPVINDTGDYVVFRSMDSFLNNKEKKCYDSINNIKSFCSSIYLYHNDSLELISDDSMDSYNCKISSSYVTFDSYSTMDLFESHYQNSTFLYDINNKITSVLVKSPNRKINNVAISNNGLFSLSISRATNVASASSYLDNLIVTNTKTNKSIIVNEGYNHDVIDGIVSFDNNKVYVLVNNKILIENLDSNAPIISSTKKLTLLKGSEYNLLKYIQVKDDLDTNVSMYVSDYSSFDINKCGTYYLTIKAIDSNNNESLFEYEVEVIEKDIEAPVFQGNKIYVININDKHFRLSDYIRVNDNVDDNLTYKIASGTFDITKKGCYKLILSSTDTSDNIGYYDVIIEVVDKDNYFNKYVGGLTFIFALVGYFIFLKKK